jgi:hypothetical protein
VERFWSSPIWDFLRVDKLLQIWSSNYAWTPNFMVPWLVKTLILMLFVHIAGHVVGGLHAFPDNLRWLDRGVASVIAVPLWWPNCRLLHQLIGLPFYSFTPLQLKSSSFGCAVHSNTHDCSWVFLSVPSVSKLKVNLAELVSEMAHNLIVWVDLPSWEVLLKNEVAKRNLVNLHMDVELSVLLHWS